MDSLELKFRAWDKNNERFLDDHELGYTRYADGTLGVNDSTPPFNKHGEIILTQFTGLYDTNNVPIYVGDILNWDAQESQPARAEIRAVPGGFILVDLWKGKEMGGEGGCWTNREVIENSHTVVGNIFEGEDE